MLTPVPAPANSADVVRELQMQLAALTTRVEIIEQRQPLAPILADSAGTRNEMQALTARVEVLELALTTVPTLRPQGTNTGVDSSADTQPTPVGRGADMTLTAADRGADTAPTGADTPAVPRKGHRLGPLRQQILDVLQAHPDGLRAEEIRVHMQAQRPIGDTLAGMVRAGIIIAQGRGPQRRYVVAE
jgi:hypothetical protein